MRSARIELPSSRRPFRLWPAVLIVALQWLLRLALPAIDPALVPQAMIAGALGWVLVVLWWLFFSRAPWIDRLLGLVLMIGGLFVTSQLLHESVAGAGMGMLFPILAVPFLSLAFVLWALAAHKLPDGPRRATMAIAILLACGMWTLVRTGGIYGAGGSEWAFRWSPTPEEKLLAEALEPAGAAELAVDRGVNLDGAAPEWPGFRGARRDGIVPATRIVTDWAASPPVEQWRRSVGPGWSSFAVQGGFFYTQEQRGEEEVVSCYDAATGEPVWRHGDATRFWEANAGAGPRGTPTLHGGRVYTFGATGIVSSLDAGDGSVVWSRNAAAEGEIEVPYWGFSSSPLVVDDLVVVALSGLLVAFDLETGEPRWQGPADPEGGDGYSSPHLAKVDGVRQILLLRPAGIVGVSPADGSLLWEHAWSGYPIVQPAFTANGDILFSVTDKSGIRRLSVAQGAGDQWTVEERWTSIRLKPYFNDFVVHKGHAYGFDGGILAAIELENGERRWKGGRYGQGQLLLLPEQDLLLVLSEDGELVLVEASPEGFTEIAKIPAIEGKTWNHPVLVDDLLLVRNDREMVAFQLARG